MKECQRRVYHYGHICAECQNNGVHGSEQQAVFQARKHVKLHHAGSGRVHIYHKGDRLYDVRMGKQKEVISTHATHNRIAVHDHL